MGVSGSCRFSYVRHRPRLLSLNSSSQWNGRPSIMMAIGAPPEKGIWQAVAPCEVVCKCLGLIPVFVDSELPLWKRWMNGGHFLVTMALIVRGTWHCLPTDLGINPGPLVVRQSGTFMLSVFYSQPFCGVVTSRLVGRKICRIYRNVEMVQNRVIRNWKKYRLQIIIMSFVS